MPDKIDASKKVVPEKISPACCFYDSKIRVCFGINMLKLNPFVRQTGRVKVAAKERASLFGR